MSLCARPVVAWLVQELSQGRIEELRACRAAKLRQRQCETQRHLRLGGDHPRGLRSLSPLRPARS